MNIQMRMCYGSEANCVQPFTKLAEADRTLPISNWYFKDSVFAIRFGVDIILNSEIGRTLQNAALFDASANKEPTSIVHERGIRSIHPALLAASFKCECGFMRTSHCVCESFANHPLCECISLQSTLVHRCYITVLRYMSVLKVIRRQGGLVCKRQLLYSMFSALLLLRL